MKKFQFKICLITLCFGHLFYADAQARNLYIEGTNHQLGVIHTTSNGNSYSGLELLRSSEFNGTDWRIVNDGGIFKLSTAINNFATDDGTVNLQMSNSGSLQLLEGSEASIGDDSGILMLGKKDGPNLAIDQNEILSRNGERIADLFLQAGPTVGNTLLNIADGDVGVGTLTPNAKLSIEDNEFQLQLKNRDDHDSDWYVGASKSDWFVGADKLVFSPSDQSRAALLILDDVDNVVDVNYNRIVKVADPINDQDAVNLRTLISHSNVTRLSSSAIRTFEECAGRCRTLVEGGLSDWHVPSVKELTQFVGGTQTGNLIWTTDIVSDYAYFKEREPDANILDYEPYHIVFSLFSGRPLLQKYDSDAECRCVK